MIAQNQPAHEPPAGNQTNTPLEDMSDMERLLRGDDEQLRRDYLEARSVLSDKLARTPSSVMQPWMHRLQEEMDAETAEIRRVEEQLEREAREAEARRRAEVAARIKRGN